MSNYVPKERVRWIATTCTNARCKAKDEAADFRLKAGAVPRCAVCGAPMKYHKGDLDHDQT